MLQGKQAPVGIERYIIFFRINAEYAAFFVQLILCKVSFRHSSS
jgi:hypothetical protein